MWIPHFGLIPWPNEKIDQNLIKKSKEDKSERDFYVGFYLENCDTREIKDSSVSLERDQFKKLNKKDGTLLIEIKLIKNEHNRLAIIDSRLKSNNYYDALRDSYNIICSYLLSIQSFQSGANLAIWGIIIKDDLYKTEWICKPQYGVPDPLKLPEIISMGDEFKAVLALYREAKNNPSPYYRFFCYYKILEAFYERSDIFRKIDRIIKEKNLPIKRPRRRITKDNLVYALVDPNSSYLGMAYGKFFEELRSNERLKVAHVFPKDKPFVNLDDFDLYTEYAYIGNLADLVSRQLLLDEVNLHLQLIDTGIFPEPKSLNEGLKSNEKNSDIERS